MRIIFLLINIFFLKFNLMSESNYINYVNEMQKKFSSNITKKYGLNCVCASGGLFKEISSLSVEFQSCGDPLTKEMLRKLLMEISKLFLNDINTNSLIKPHMKKFPFDHSDITIMIYNVNNKGVEWFFPNIAVSQIRNSKIYYYYEDEFNHCGYKLIETENLEDAEELLTN